MKVIANDGEPLYTHGYWNLLGNVASREGYNFLYDTAPYRSLLSNANAAVLSKIFLDDLEGKTMTIKEGMDAIPLLLVDEFLNASLKHTKNMNHKLECVHEGDHGYKLSFWLTRTRHQKTVNTYEQEEVCARNVVLALPKFALESLNWGPANVPINRIYQYLQTVEDIPSLRVIFVYNQTWWNHRHAHMGHVITDLPIRQVRYLGSQLVPGPLTHSPADEKHIFLAASPDSTDVDYFSDLSEQFRLGKKSATSSKIISDISRQIAKVYDIKEDDMPEPETVLVQDWSGSLSGAGWHLWKKGVNYDKLVRRIMQPSRRDSIYIVGSTYCGGSCQLWAEGALKTVEELLRTHLSPIDIRKR